MPHRPNQKKDKRKRRIKDDICSFEGCKRPSNLTYYGLPLCDTCYTYYCGLPCKVIKKILGIKDEEPEKIPEASQELDTFEEEMFE